MTKTTIITLLIAFGAAAVALTARVRARVHSAAVSTVLVLADGRSSPRAPRRSRSEFGEGVISAAIAVLIIASLGALMWVGYKALWQNAEQTTNSEIAKIGK